MWIPLLTTGKLDATEVTPFLLGLTDTEAMPFVLGFMDTKAISSFLVLLGTEAMHHLLGLRGREVTPYLLRLIGTGPSLGLTGTVSLLSLGLLGTKATPPLLGITGTSFTGTDKHRPLHQYEFVVHSSLFLSYTTSCTTQL